MSITGILLKAFEGAFNDRLKGICLIFLSFIINGAITNAERHTQMPSWVRSLFDFILIKKPSLPENVGLIPQDTVGRESGRQQQGGPNQHHDQNNQQQQESRQHQQGVQHGSHSTTLADSTSITTTISSSTTEVIIANLQTQVFFFQLVLMFTVELLKTASRVVQCMAIRCAFSRCCCSCLLSPSLSTTFERPTLRCQKS